MNLHVYIYINFIYYYNYHYNYNYLYNYYQNNKTILQDNGFITILRLRVLRA